MGAGGGDRIFGDDPRAPIPPPPAWQLQAGCLGMDTALWFPERGQQPARGLAVCENECPVRVECGQWAIAQGFDVGTFGGMTPQERVRGAAASASRQPLTEVCAADGCDRDHYARGVCKAHYQAALRAERQHAAA